MIGYVFGLSPLIVVNDVDKDPIVNMKESWWLHLLVVITDKATSRLWCVTCVIREYQTTHL